MPSKSFAAPTLRVAEGPRDWAAVRSLFVELQEYGRTADDRLPPGEDVADEYLAAQLHRCREHEGRILVAEVEGEILGYVCVLAKVPCAESADGLAVQAEVVDLVVSSKARSGGIGKALLRSAEGYAVSVGTSNLRVSVFATNDSAQRFYDSNGFELYEVVYEKRMLVG